MKKLFAVLLTVTMMACMFASCDKKDKSGSSAKTDVITENANGLKCDSKLTGGWTGEELQGGVLYFSKDNKLSQKVDYTKLQGWTFDESAKMLKVEGEGGGEFPYTYDGTNFEVEEYGLHLVREGSADESTINGTYGPTEEEKAMMGGIEIYFIINDGNAVMEMVLGEYSADGKMCKFFGKSSVVFGSFAENEDEGTEAEYTIDGDTLTIKNPEGGSDLVLDRAK